MPTLLVGWGVNEDAQATGWTAEDCSEAKPLPSVVHLADAVHVRAVSCGSRHTLVLADDGGVFSWGWGKQGQLGHGSLRSCRQPRRIEAFRAVGAVVQVSAGGIHSGAVVQDGRVYTWGASSFGQLGQGPAAMDAPVLEPAPVSYPPVLPAPEGPPAAPTPFLASHLSCGGMHTGAVASADGSVWCWGRADSGQTAVLLAYDDASGTLGVAWPHRVQSGFGGARAVGLSCGAFHTAAVMDDATAWAWGKEDFGMLGAGASQNLREGVYRPIRMELPEGEEAVSVACGGWHTVVLTRSGKALSCGRGELGRLGLGDDRSRNKPEPLASLGERRVVMASAGGTHTLLLTDEGEVLASGRGDGGRLGQGNFDNHLTPQPISATALGAGARVLQVCCGGAHSAALLEVPEGAEVLSTARALRSRLNSASEEAEPQSPSSPSSFLDPHAGLSERQRRQLDQMISASKR